MFFTVSERKVAVNPLQPYDSPFSLNIRLPKFIEDIPIMPVILGAQVVKRLHGGHIFIKTCRVNGSVYLVQDTPAPFAFGGNIHALGKLHKTSRGHLIP